MAQEEPLALLGPTAQPGDRFPLLVKLLEIGPPLSVQVHPDAATARQLGDGDSGKCEAWWVLDVGPQGRVWSGWTTPPPPDELAALSESGLLLDQMRSFVPDPGEGVEILPGTFHTARDVLVLEVQETCDVTYRAYDFERGRELHLASARACLERIPRSAAARQRTSPDVPCDLAANSPFAFEVFPLEPEQEVTVPPGGPQVLVTSTGRAQLGGLELAAGQAAVIPASAGPVALRGGAQRSLLARGWVRPQA